MCVPCVDESMCVPCVDVSMCVPCVDVSMCAMCRRVHVCAVCRRVHVCAMCRRVLELGSGSGFLGSVICSVCAPSSFTFSDCHDEVIELLVENVCRNLHFTGEFSSDASAV